MSARVFVLLGKFGDCINALPIIEREYKTSHKKPTVVTSPKYAAVFDGCAYVGKVINFTGKWGDLHSAIKFAKGMFNDVTVLQCHGDNFPFQQTKPSFQHEVYDRVKLLREWPNMRPNFDRRDAGREMNLVKSLVGDSEKFILLADQSESSQFKLIEELKLMIHTKFGGEYKIIHLSKVRAQKIYDLLGLYERAAALVTTETVHTHLSMGCNVPTFVLAADGWRGSAFRKSFGFYLKYADWERRKNDFIGAIDNFLTGKQPLKVFRIN